ncbi:hypothetical protein SM11_pD0996 (plasmid) [Sinorhizobium meliloti SM11]|uniref:Uncharacterized protein n=1 Tax=Sinorhizobium meliloti (strain SM11) TaxID=707241 RepID=F7XH02_SINMM|nr:hypothetical protein SM11_pD0996 [Sinorhizobium meliloti SM11]
MMPALKFLTAWDHFLQAALPASRIASRVQFVSDCVVDH